MQRKNWKRQALYLNQFWARAFLTLSFIPPRVEWKGQLKEGQNYIFVGNHTSYLDIVLMGYVPRPCTFVGKISLTKVPLFGYMFRKLHITVDRKSARSRHQVMQRGAEVLKEGKSLVMFPEGGIVTEHPPQMAAFKNGAFKLAIDMQVPIVPVVFPYNWHIQPNDNKLIMYPKRPKAVFLAPVDTRGMRDEDVESLKWSIRKSMEDELARYYPEMKKNHYED
ncbi:MAG: lysophospholipid acyltransferase family protein [Cyclobacteriaceae bacterium]